MKNYILRESTKKTKKFDLVDEEGKVISFGQKNASDFTIHNDTQRKDRYINRHYKVEHKFWGHNNDLTPSYLSRWLLWEKPTLQKAIKFIEENRNISISY